MAFSSAVNCCKRRRSSRGCPPRKPRDLALSALDPVPDPVLDPVEEPAQIDGVAFHTGSPFSDLIGDWEQFLTQTGRMVAAGMEPARSPGNWSCPSGPA